MLGEFNIPFNLLINLFLKKILKGFYICFHLLLPNLMNGGGWGEAGGRPHIALSCPAHFSRLYAVMFSTRKIKGYSFRLLDTVIFMIKIFGVMETAGNRTSQAAYNAYSAQRSH